MDNLESKFWDILNNVRGHRDIRDLKELFISLLFLKYANDKFKPDSNNAIDVPEESRWDNLAIHSLLIFEFVDSLKKAFLTLEKVNPKIVKTFSEFDFLFDLNKKDDFELIRSLFFEVSDFDFSKDKYCFTDVIGGILKNFAVFEGKRGDDITTPDSVSQLMIELLNPKQGTILDSACGTGGFFQNILDSYPDGIFQFYGQEFNNSTLAIAKLRFAFNNEIKFKFGDAKSTLIEDQFPDLKADYVLMHPPFNMKFWMDQNTDTDPRFKFGIPSISNANMAWVQHAIHHLNGNGKAAVLLNNSALSSGGKEAEIRKNIIKADLVESIISLPSQMLSNTSISSSIWILNNNKLLKEEVIFIDATNFGQKSPIGTHQIFDAKSIKQLTSVFQNWQNNKSVYAGHVGFFQIVRLKEIIENDFLLTPSRYTSVEDKIKQDLSKAIALGSVLNHISPKKLDPNVSYKKISIKDLSSNPDSYFLETENLTELKLSSNYRLLQNNVLLIPRLGDKLKFSFHKESNMQIAYSANSIFAFKVDTTKVNLDYLIAELFKLYFSFQFSAFKFGAGIQLIRLKDLLNIKIIIPSLEQQKEIFEQERQLRFQSKAKDLGFEKEVALIKQNQMKDLGSKKHNIMQHLNNVKASTDVLMKMMELNKGVLNSDAIIDPRRGVSVGKRFLRLQESLDKVIYYVDNITNELQYDDSEIINPITFIKECKERGIENDNFSIEIITDKETFDSIKPLISISKNDFEELYNNILENALKHGFIDESKSYIFRVTIAYVDDLLEINFENNGKPFPKGIAEKLDVKGEKAGATAGTGIGLWKVAEIAKHFACKLEVLDEPQSEFPVGFKFKFNLETL